MMNSTSSFVLQASFNLFQTKIPVMVGGAVEAPVTTDRRYVRVQTPGKLILHSHTVPS